MQKTCHNDRSFNIQNDIVKLIVLSPSITTVSAMHSLSDIATKQSK